MTPEALKDLATVWLSDLVVHVLENQLSAEPGDTLFALAQDAMVQLAIDSTPDALTLAADELANLFAGDRADIESLISQGLGGDNPALYLTRLTNELQSAEAARRAQLKNWARAVGKTSKKIARFSADLVEGLLL